MRTFLISLLSLMFTPILMAEPSVKTERLYLSGHGCDDPVLWDFMCTGGNHSGTWTKIAVPSCWELQGFGTYQYGIKFYGKAHPEGIADEKGLYKYEFTIPAEWKNRQIELVFEGSMTDTEVLINGRKAGPIHQGAFYRFKYDVSDRVFFGKSKKNLLEVTVSKESSDDGVNLAERRADYWNFGGIFRPVFIEASPDRNIAQVSIDAKADGVFKAICSLNHAIDNVTVKAVITDEKGNKVAETSVPVRKGGDAATLEVAVKSPSLWTAETPTRYTAAFSLVSNKGIVLHEVSRKFGFRTIETRLEDGLYINGVKVKIRGVNRHSFRPESGRTLSKAKNIEDVMIIKSMNMNAVRMSHYPPDPDFLNACDSLGLYVMDELGGWHGKYETAIGQKLVREMVTRDVNHPSIIWWSNGNEGGWNTDLDGEFGIYDCQHRPIIHPLGTFGGYQTMHYRSYGESEEAMRKPLIYMPTEFLHGLYDGGLGAGLADYWNIMQNNPLCTGGFLWSFVDEGVKRTDKNGLIDCQGSYAPDGIVGPHHEKEGSYYTIKQVWCPVQLLNKTIDNTFDGVLDIENRFDFLNINTCSFTYKYAKLPAFGERGDMKILKSGRVQGNNIPAHNRGEVRIPTPVDGANLLLVTADDKNGNELFTWSYSLSRAPKYVMTSSKVPSYQETTEVLTVSAGGRTFTFGKKDGQLEGVKIGTRMINLTGGPRFVAARRADRSFDQYYNHDDKEVEEKKTQYLLYEDYGKFEGFDIKEDGKDLIVTANYKHGSFNKAVWRIDGEGTAMLDYTYTFGGVVDLMGVMFNYPENKVLNKRWVGDGPYRVWQNRLDGPQLGVWENDYNDPIPGESFTYPEFKGYFANVQWMNIKTSEGVICIGNQTTDNYIGVYQPRDGRESLLYTLPATGISFLKVIPPVRNKVNSTDLIGPSSQPFWAKGKYDGNIILKFE